MRAGDQSLSGDRDRQVLQGPQPAALPRHLRRLEIAVSIREGEVLWGTFPKRALAHVMEWREAHVAELEQDWERARAKQPLLPVEPLE